MNPKPILPGGTIGVLGSGQLGRMLALAARRMGYRIHTLSPDADSPTGQIADREVVAAYDDLEAVRDFARGVDVVTFEFENVSAEATAAAAEFAPVRPGGSVLHITQNRLREKTFLRDRGFPVTPFASIAGRDSLHKAVRQFGGAGVLKTAGFGYDGKGQRTIRTSVETDAAWDALGGGLRQVRLRRSASEAEPEGDPESPLTEIGRAAGKENSSLIMEYAEGNGFVLEAFVEFACEVSVVAARGVDGSFAHYGVVRNDHANHILDVTMAPSPAHDVSSEVAGEAVEIARGILEALDVVGVLCVEFFLTTDGELLINELAPRPHNSGHWTIEGCPASQFEQQLRAVCGLPLGDTTPRCPAAMANLLGDLWLHGEPDWAAALALPDVHLHLYGKREPRPGRKMGHLTALADTPEAAGRLARAARAALTERTSSRKDVTKG